MLSVLRVVQNFLKSLMCIKEVWDISRRRHTVIKMQILKVLLDSVRFYCCC